MGARIISVSAIVTLVEWILDVVQVANSLDGIVGVGAVDCEVSQSLCAQYGVKGFPTIKGFGADRQVSS